MFRRKIFFSIVFLSIVLLSSVSSQEKETLAVLDFKTEAVSETEMNAIVEFLSAELFNTDKFIVIDVSQRQTILEEMEFSMSGCTDDSCALEIGKMLSAELIVTGNLSKVGSRYLMSVKMLQTETSRTMGTANGKFGDLDELIDGLEEIAFDLAGKEAASVAEQPQENTTAPERIPEAESEPEPEPEIVTDAEKAKPAAETTPAETAKAAVEPEPSEGGMNIVALIAAETGTALMTAGSIFSSFSVIDRITAEDAYDEYMAATVDPGFYYSTSSDTTVYEDYYGLYERDTMVNYIGSGTGSALLAVSGFLGNEISFGGKITYATATALLAAGNVLSVLSANNAIESGELYSDYMSAGTDAAAQNLWTEYSYIYSDYEILQYTSYGLVGTAGLLAAASWFIPGEKTAATSGILQEILYGAGYLLMAGGNFTKSIAMNKRFEVEDLYDQYMSAGMTDSAVALYGEYENAYWDYEKFTYMSYGFWGLGAAAIVTGILLPENSGVETAETGFDFAVRPALTGFGVEVDIKLK